MITKYRIVFGLCQIIHQIKMGNSNFEHTPQTKFPHGTTASQKATVRAFDKFYRYGYK